MRNVSDRPAGSALLRPYASRHRQGVERLLLSGGRVFPDDDLPLLLDGLDSTLRQDLRIRSLGRVVETMEEARVRAASWVEPVPWMPDRWVLRLLFVDPRERGKGLGFALLAASEEYAERCGANCLGVEVPWFAETEPTESFLRCRGYGPYDGMGLPKRYPKSRYFLRELL